MTEQIIMVQVSDPEWTAGALHLACRLAQRHDAQLALVHLIPVQHLGWLGTDFAYSLVTPQTQRQLHKFELTLEDYGMISATYVMQCISLTQGIVQAAELTGAQIVFAHLPKSFLPYWAKFEWNSLRRRLARQHRTLMEQDMALLDARTMGQSEAVELGLSLRH